jgi:isopentenyl diphosphate isomerase/L-lactate dehydrogenase-like FMN-dependent dehydrogenase
VELSEIYQKGKENLSQRDGKCPIIVDGGFRRGSDVAKGLAFGANLVGLGRPILYGLAADGKNGVRDLILQITAELKRIMSILGAARAGEMDRGMLILGNA